MKTELGNHNIYFWIKQIENITSINYSKRARITKAEKHYSSCLTNKSNYHIVKQHITKELYHTLHFFIGMITTDFFRFELSVINLNDACVS